MIVGVPSTSATSVLRTATFRSARIAQYPIGGVKASPLAIRGSIELSWRAWATTMALRRLKERNLMEETDMIGDWRDGKVFCFCLPMRRIYIARMET